MNPLRTAQRILIVDDHVIIRRGLRNLITARLSGMVVEDVATLAAMDFLLARGPEPDLMLLDLQLSDGNAMDRLPDLHKVYPGLRMLIYSMNSERLYGQRVLALGCAGFLSKNATEDEVMRAIQLVLHGGSYIGYETELRILDQMRDKDPKSPSDPFERLSGREMRVLNELLAGAGVKEISTRMGLGISTVATYKARLFDKLGVTNLMDLQTLARAHKHYHP